MSDASTSPRLYRSSTLKDFLPLNEEASISTRGQHLPGILSSRSNTNIAALRKSAFRRSSSIGPDDLPRRRSQESERQHDVEAQRKALMAVRGGTEDNDDRNDRKMSTAASVLNTPQMRSQRLIGNSNPRYKWEQYWKTEEELGKMTKPIRKYYERNNELIQHYMYIDRLLDSSLPHNLIQEYQQPGPPTGNTFSPSGESPVRTWIGVFRSLYHLQAVWRLSDIGKSPTNGAIWQTYQQPSPKSQHRNSRLV